MGGIFNAYDEDFFEKADGTKGINHFQVSSDVPYYIWNTGIRRKRRKEEGARKKDLIDLKRLAV